MSCPSYLSIVGHASKRYTVVTHGSVTYYLDAAKVVGKTERPSPLLEIF